MRLTGLYGVVCLELACRGHELNSTRLPFASLYSMSFMFV